METTLINHFFTNPPVALNSVGTGESTPSLSNPLTTFSSYVDSLQKQKLIKQLAKNKKLFAELGKELGLEIAEEEPIEIPQKVPNPAENQASSSGSNQNPEEIVASGSGTINLVLMTNLRLKNLRKKYLRTNRKLRNNLKKNLKNSVIYPLGNFSN